MPRDISYYWYEALSHLCHLSCTLGLSFRHEGWQHVPATGPALLVANHQSFFDPVLVGVAARRHLSYLARKTLFRNPFFGWLIRSLHAVPIDQEGIGRDGLQTILEQLAEGRAVLVFPEGARTHNGSLQPFRPGVRLLITRSQAPIIPVGIAGAYHAWPIWRSYPLPGPIFVPPSERTCATVIGAPLDGRVLARLPREQIMQIVYDHIHQAQQRAEQLRRKE